MQVVHCVMYPRMEYDLPILSFDMVGKNDRVSLVCMDPCPVAMDRSLPPVYVSLVRYTPPAFAAASALSATFFSASSCSGLVQVL